MEEGEGGGGGGSGGWRGSGGGGKSAGEVAYPYLTPAALCRNTLPQEGARGVGCLQTHQSNINSWNPRCVMSDVMTHI